MQTNINYDEPFLSLPYNDFVKLYKNGSVTAQIDAMGAINLGASGVVNTSTSIFLFYLGSLIFIASVVASFFVHWWIFIPGFFVAVFFNRLSKNTRANDVLKAILSNENIYNIAIERKFLFVFPKRGFDASTLMEECEEDTDSKDDTVPSENSTTENLEEFEKKLVILRQILMYSFLITHGPKKEEALALWHDAEFQKVLASLAQTTLQESPQFTASVILKAMEYDTDGNQSVIAKLKEFSLELQNKGWLSEEIPLYDFDSMRK